MQVWASDSDVFGFDSQQNSGCSYLFVAEVSLVEADSRQLVALTDVKHRNRVTSIQQLLHQVSAQETGSSDDCTPFITLCHMQKVLSNSLKAKRKH